MGFFSHFVQQAQHVVQPVVNATVDPFKQTASSVEKVFTDPGKANLGDFISTAIPGLGGTIVNDVKHPADAAIQAGIVASAGAVYGAIPAGPPALNLTTEGLAGPVGQLGDAGSVTPGFFSNLEGEVSQVATQGENIFQSVTGGLTSLAKTAATALGLAKLFQTPAAPASHSGGGGTIFQVSQPGATVLNPGGGGGGYYGGDGGYTQAAVLPSSGILSSPIFLIGIVVIAVLAANKKL